MTKCSPITPHTFCERAKDNERERERDRERGEKEECVCEKRGRMEIKR